MRFKSEGEPRTNEPKHRKGKGIRDARNHKRSFWTQVSRTESAIDSHTGHTHRKPGRLRNIIHGRNTADVRGDTPTLFQNPEEVHSPESEGQGSKELELFSGLDEGVQSERMDEAKIYIRPDQKDHFDRLKNRFADFLRETNSGSLHMQASKDWLEYQEANMLFKLYTRRQSDFSTHHPEQSNPLFIRQRFLQFQDLQNFSQIAKALRDASLEQIHASRNDSETGLEYTKAQRAFATHIFRDYVAVARLNRSSGEPINTAMLTADTSGAVYKDLIMTQLYATRIAQMHFSEISGQQLVPIKSPLLV